MDLTITYPFLNNRLKPASKILGEWLYLWIDIEAKLF